jgi:tetratricopeptide (TPR) repeat protein
MAIEDFTKAVETDPDSAELYFKRSLAYYVKAEFSKAWADVHKVLELGSPVPEGYLKALNQTTQRSR